MLKKTSHNRAIAATSINERSSHSHNLAGSERLNMSGSTRNGLRETQSANKRLSCPGDICTLHIEAQSLHTFSSTH
ncbi:hypothetical protein BDF14DRAFT_1763560 [Spinellus fusiger]|nr:hypothetical protein BDF14DRAFT_1763560 [Spinellus fusiger]